MIFGKKSFEFLTYLFIMAYTIQNDVIHFKMAFIKLYFFFQFMNKCLVGYVVISLEFVH